MIDFNDLEAQREDNQLEVKLAASGLPKSIWESYSAFANTSGGVILLGVEELPDRSLRVVGVSDPNAYISDFWNTINNRSKVNLNILSNRHVYVEKTSGKNIIVVNIPRADRHYRPVYINTDIFNGTFRRNGEGDYHCTAEEVKAMLRDQTDVAQDVRPLPSFGLDMVNADSLRRYRNRFSQFKPDHVWNGLDDNDFLEKIGAARLSEDEKPHLTGAGLLVFGNEYDIVKEFPNYFLDYRENNTANANVRWIDRVISSSGDWSGNLFDFYFRVIDRLTKDIKTPFALKDGLDRVDVTNVHTAMREALANALIHSDYYGRQGVLIEKIRNIITISNPGDSRVSVEEAFSGGVSDPRNACIIKIFSLIGVGERAGSGLYNIKTVWEQQHWQRPKLTQKYSPARTFLTVELGSPSWTCDDINWHNEDANEGGNKKKDVFELKNEVINPFNGDISSAGEVINHQSEDISLLDDVIKLEIRDLFRRGAAAQERALVIVKLLALDPHISIPQLASAAKIPKSTVERMLSNLCRRGIVVRVGSKKNGQWLLNASLPDITNSKTKENA
ncbi:MAG: putative DNA binding domain-containing protein [Cloacibacillus sp.]